jgi:hypothetical protein
VINREKRMRKETLSMLQQLADKHRLTIRRNEDGTDVIISSLGHLYEYSDDELAIMFIPAEPHPRAWTSVQGKCLVSGMTLRQTGDCEGAFSFDPADSGQVKTALDVLKLRRKKRISADHLRALRAGLSKAAHNREKCPSTGPLAAPIIDDLGQDGTSHPPRNM